jgi:DNA-binding transcriptional MerR regulator
MGRPATVLTCLDTRAVCGLADVPDSTLDYWVRTRLITPSLRTDPGRRRTRLWTIEDAIVVRTIAQLRKAGCSLQNLKKAKAQLDPKLGGLSAKSTLFWTGNDVIEIRPDGDAQSLVKEPFQQVFLLMALPIGGWQEEAKHCLSYIRRDHLRLGHPYPTEEEARAAR